MAAKKPPKAGPMEKPRFIAILLREKARVIFSGFAYEVIDTELAGRNISETRLRMKIPIDKLIKVCNCGNRINMGTETIKLNNCTLKCPNLSVNQPPNTEPITAPTPKQLNTIPASVKLKFSDAVM